MRGYRSPQRDNAKYQGDFDRYWRDVTAWQTRLEVRSDRRQQQKQQQVTHAQAQQLGAVRQVFSAHAQNIAEFAKATPDYAESLQSLADWNVEEHPAVAAAILKSENSARLLYSLSKQPAEFARIAAITDPERQYREIVKIDARLSASPTASCSKSSSRSSPRACSVP